MYLLALIDNKQEEDTMRSAPSCRQHNSGRIAFAQSLSGNQIRDTLIGNTLTGVADGESYSEHLNSDGTISG
jgi:hypothetical protein